MKKTLFATVLAGLMSFSGTLLADSACKGVGKSQCEANDNCTWVEGYRKKDGSTVKGYCRDKGKRAEKKGGKSEDKKANKDSKSKKDKDNKKDKKSNKDKDSKKDKKNKKDKDADDKDKD